MQIEFTLPFCDTLLVLINHAHRVHGPSSICTVGLNLFLTFKLFYILYLSTAGCPDKKLKIRLNINYKKNVYQDESYPFNNPSRDSRGSADDSSASIKASIKSTYSFPFPNWPAFGRGRRWYCPKPNMRLLVLIHWRWMLFPSFICWFSV